MTSLTGKVLSFFMAFSFAAVPAVNASANPVNQYKPVLFSVPVQLPAVPEYAGRKKFEQGSYFANTFSGPIVCMRYESKDIASSVLDFYRMYLPQYKWTITSEASNNDKLTATNNETGNTITILIAAPSQLKAGSKCEYSVAYTYNKQALSYNTSKASR